MNATASMTALALLVSVTGCSDLGSFSGKGKGRTPGQAGDGDNQGDGADGDEDEYIPPEPYPGCREYSGNRYYVRDYVVLMDPVDFYGESWDWDGGGIGEFEEQYGDYIDYLVFILSEGQVQPGSLDLYWELAEIFAPIVASYYVSPDLTADVYWWDDRSEELEFLGYQDNYDESTVFPFGSFEMQVRTSYDGYYLEFYDRDLAFDDYAGWTVLDGFLLAETVDCGPMVWLLDDATMRAWDTRVRAVYLEVEACSTWSAFA